MAGHVSFQKRIGPVIPAVALDLGSTAIKGAILGPDDALSPVLREPAPRVTGTGLERESDAADYLRIAADLLERLTAGLPESTPVGIASQRSSFLLWERKSGAPVTPLISWQDRRAEKLCRRETRRLSGPVSKTGLPLSPHYAGPKLAWILTADDGLTRAARAGKLLFGTLETYLVWQWSPERVHQTDLSMAARTLLADPESGTWSHDLIAGFSIPRPLLPDILPTWGKRIPLGMGGVVTATIADQPAIAVSGRASRKDALFVNLGTGGFVLKPTGSDFQKVPGYLSGPMFESPDRHRAYALEGTVNGIGEAVDGDSGRLSPFPELGEGDSFPSAFLVPDRSGIGAPFWLADPAPPASEATAPLSGPDRRRVVMEGIIFRIAGIVFDLCGQEIPERIFLSGGLAGVDFLSRGLAACLDRPLFRRIETEATLAGAARMAIRRPGSDSPLQTERIDPTAGLYLKEKFFRWKRWADRAVDDLRRRRVPEP